MIIDALRIQVHGFCDASERAYYTCIYIRSALSGEEPSSRLLYSKSRVAPLKTISLPRLELCAAVLLAQLFEKIRNSFKTTDFRAFLWSDSSIMLNWIMSPSRKWTVFVANRVSEIHRLSNIADWKHVLSAENPADLLACGLSPTDLSTACDGMAQDF